jgi:pimeloyl-ACP methyl ester carboxylesterase
MAFMERIVFVHGSVMGGRPTWNAQRVLDDRFELDIWERPGFAPNPPVEQVDFDADAVALCERLLPGSHVVGHSAGGVVALLAAARAPELIGSLTVVEPPAMDVARGVPAVDRFIADGAEWWTHGPRDDPEAFLRGFLRLVGSDYDPPSPLPPALEQGARALIGERPQWEARIPLAELAQAPFPKLVVSGAHSAAFDAVCDVLERQLNAERVVLAGYGHTAQRHPEFNELLASFVEPAAALRPSPHAGRPAR